MWKWFTTVVDEVIFKTVPTKVIKERSYPKWMTRSAKLAAKFKSTMWSGLDHLRGTIIG